MSTPERQDDPGEYGYGSAKQDLPDEQAGDAGKPSADDEQPPADDDEEEPGV